MIALREYGHNIHAYSCFIPTPKEHFEPLLWLALLSPVPRRPWIHQPQFRLIDELWAEEIPEHFANRMLPEEFGAKLIMMKAEEEKRLQESMTNIYTYTRQALTATSIPTSAHIQMKFIIKIEMVGF
jgi:hypothetical protein